MTAWNAGSENRSPSCFSARRAAAGSRAADLYRAPARPADVAIHLVEMFTLGQAAVLLAHEPSACARVQPIACRPVSTTSREARHAS